MVEKKPRVCFGMTLYNKAKYLPEAIESLLNQTYDDFFLVAVDDCSTDETEEIMRQYEAQDERVSYFRNETWSGMIATWQAAFYKAFDLYQPDYFAWASDHDVWHPEWLSHHVHVLNEHRNVVLAYPQTIPISAEGEAVSYEQPQPFETFGMSDVDRLYHACSSKQSGAGHAIYGLFRVEALIKAGVFRRVMMPDRLLVTEISAYGAIKQIPKQLWSRRYFGPPKTQEETLAGQRRYLFGPSPVPIHAYCPFISHALSLALYTSILPPKGDYLTFWRGLLMAGMLWETYKERFIKEEFATLREILAAGSIPTQVYPDLPDVSSEEVTIAREITAVAESILGGPTANTDSFSNLQRAFIIALMLNRDATITALREEVEQSRIEAKLARAKAKAAKAEAERAKELAEEFKSQAEKWRAEASLGIGARVKRQIRRVMSKIASPGS